jgi:hypothetical protein
MRLREKLATRLALNLNAGLQEILPGLWTSDEISERPEAEGKSDYHLMREGEAAFFALTQVLGPSVVRPCPAGTALEF